jgi:hypothetical protein
MTQQKRCSVAAAKVGMTLLISAASLISRFRIVWTVTNLQQRVAVQTRDNRRSKARGNRGVLPNRRLARC